MVPKVETFEQDIVDEIKRKDASLTEISSASNNVGNEPVELPKKKPVFLIVLGVCFTLFLGGISFVGYIYYTDPLLNPETQRKQITPEDVPKIPQDLNKLAPTIANNVGQYVAKVDKKERGYVLTITNYPAVFAYFTRHENEYINELANIFSAPDSDVVIEVSNKIPTIVTVDTPDVPQTTTTQTVATNTSIKITNKAKLLQKTTKIAPGTSTKSFTGTSSLSTATTTEIIQSTTTPATTTQETISKVAKFTDVTLSNQNIRVWTFGKRSVAYAFVSNTMVIISDSAEGVLTIKGAILH